MVAVALALSVTVPAAGEMQLHEIGRSIEGRPISMSVLGPPDAPTRVLVVGAIHGDEPGTLAVTRRLRRRAPPSGVALWVIDTLNPDGLARRTRQNARGVDLNRNFPRRWRWLGPPGSRNYSGRGPLSEPESRIAAEWIRFLRPQVTVWLHQPYDLVDLTEGADAPVVRAYARAAQLRVNRTPGELPGGAPTWQNSILPGSSAFIVELSPGRVSAAEASRHARAIRAVARRAACIRVGRCR